MIRDPPNSPVPRSALGRLWLRSCIFHTLDLPEWKLFPSPGEHDRAMADVAYGRMPGLVGTLSRPVWLILISVAAAFVVLYSVDVLSPAGIPAGWKSAMSLCVYLTGGGVAMWFVHRPAAARFLRARLIDLGVLVCRACGYDLRGQSVGADGARVCPECGRASRDAPGVAGGNENRPGG